MMKLPIIAGIVSLIVVAAAGLYATDFTAYLGSDPATCNNCHVMDTAYEGWYHAGHKLWAKCNDCHTPHALIPKYIVKAQSGYHHVTAFFFGDIPDAIRAKPSSRDVVQENCIRCHFNTVEDIMEGPVSGTKLQTSGISGFSQAEGESVMDPGRYCFECHRTTAHGERGISLLPYQHMEENK